MRSLAFPLAALAVLFAYPALAQDESVSALETAAVETAVPSSAPTEAVGPAFPVSLRRDGGSRNALTEQPRIALFGYNLAAFTSSRVTASSGGSLFGGGMGARARMDFNLVGIDRALLERVATAAHDNLVAQLQAAGYEVVPAQQIFANGEGSRFLAEGGAYEAEAPGTENDFVVVGPAGVGAVAHHGIARTSFAGNAPAPISAQHSAILLYPNLALDFVQTGGSGRRALGNRANVSGEARFGVNPISVVQAQFSRTGRFIDGWTTLNMRDGVSVDDEFATVGQTSESNNNAAVIVSAILGAGMQSARRSGYDVVADPAAYEALAMRAARGFNAAIVAQVREARGQ